MGVILRRAWKAALEVPWMWISGLSLSRNPALSMVLKWAHLADKTHPLLVRPQQRCRAAYTSAPPLPLPARYTPKGGRPETHGALSHASTGVRS